MVELSLKGFGHSVEIDRLRAHALTLIFKTFGTKKCWVMLIQVIYID